MNRATLFALGIAAAVVCLIIAIVYLQHGTPLGYHRKHAAVFFGLAVIAALFAAINRPLRSRV